MALGAIRKLDLEKAQEEELFGQILDLDLFNQHTRDRTSPETIEQIMIVISSYVNNPDPFYQEKRQLNETVMGLYAPFEKRIDQAPDPLYMAVKLAIIGNTIDFMLPKGTEDIENDINERLKVEVSEKAYANLRQALLSAQRIVYFTDNAGEIVLDKLLVNTLRQFCDPDIVFVVRNMPTLNDATLNEAKQVGLESAAPVLANGIDGPLPGTILERCSSKVRDLVETADLIISKGGGNFDCLSEEVPHLNTDISFLLLSKCHPYNTYFKADLYQPIVAHFKADMNSMRYRGKS